jgi:hypothetical protein
VALPTIFMLSVLGLANLMFGIILLILSNIRYCRRTGQNSFMWIWIGDARMTREERFINRLGIALTGIGLVISWGIVGWTDFFLPEGWTK